MLANFLPEPPGKAEVNRDKHHGNPHGRGEREAMAEHDASYE
jgi:hypothetical protein